MLNRDFIRVTFYRFFTNIPVGYLALLTIIDPTIALLKSGTALDLIRVYNLDLNTNFALTLIFSFVIGEVFCTIGDIILGEIFNLKLNERDSSSNKSSNYDLEHVDPFSGRYEKISYEDLCKFRRDYCFEMSEIFFSLSRMFMGFALIIFFAICIANLSIINSEKQAERVDFRDDKKILFSELHYIKVFQSEKNSNFHEKKPLPITKEVSGKNSDSSNSLKKDHHLIKIIVLFQLALAILLILFFILKNLNLLKAIIKLPFKLKIIIVIIVFIAFILPVIFNWWLINSVFSELFILTYLFLIFFFLLAIYYRRGANIKLVTANKIGSEKILLIKR